MFEWLLVAAMGVIAVGLGVAMLSLQRWLGPPPHSEAVKNGAYECGVPPLGNAREQFPVKYYLVAILFVLFDIETVFLIPWTVVYRDLGLTGLVEMFVFLGVLSYGLLYAWRRGALDWN